ncbi:DUF6643 family protein [Streptomyces xanthophaeus]|uniref:Uncharacterized protein n=1 Tax=Streptomyces xanthophaeus TaxID=67385 RepID=A0A919GZ57_9ACTN|nr:DUF6643 family protein [Streptomyces xanthophaeus]WST21022.1 hypothetical protein OG264_05635 [Streptomyces xanthophaeus]WST63991.1 hypothetical protein OG605_32725 [Streptomyces xanthophaeus]GHI83798.1 hypothetical protein Sxan_11620 [Streptomyces xanthophaeus]
MTSPRSTYGGGYYSAPSFPDTPIYDSLVAERGTPQIAPIRVPAAYDSPSAGYSSGGYLPALASSLPALPPAMPQQQQAPAYGYPYQQQAAPQPMPLQHAPAPYIPQQQPVAARAGYVPQPQPQQPRPVAAGTGYEAMRPAAPRPMQAPVQGQAPSYEDPYGRQYQGRGY